VNRLGILLSSKFVEVDVSEVYGDLPPSFLPVGNQRLYVKQIEVLSQECNRIVMTLPIDYRIPNSDIKLIETLGVEIIRVDKNFTIEEVIIFCLEVIGDTSLPFEILYGDTILRGDMPLDSVAVAIKPDRHLWGKNESILKLEHMHGSGVEFVMAGRFCFSDQKSFLGAVAQSTGEILTTMMFYEGFQPLSYFVGDGWLDFGHLSTLQQSKLAATESRYFNSIEISDSLVTKRSSNLQKLKKEIAWYRSVPSEAERFVPKMRSWGADYYELDYIASPTLHELLVLGNLDRQNWLKIFQGLAKYFKIAISIKPDSCDESLQLSTLSELLDQKTFQRAAEFLSQNSDLSETFSVDIDTIISHQNITFLINQIDMRNRDSIGFFHGDLCATNIFWDSRKDTCKLIDPRGQNSKSSTVPLGDLRYDIAKIYQSFVLGYDLVLEDKFEYVPISGHLKLRFLDEPQSDFYRDLITDELCKPLGIDVEEIHIMGIILMIGLLPLHSDRPDRQNAFLQIISQEFESLHK
jgi:hypothetical protein